MHSFVILITFYYNFVNSGDRLLDWFRFIQIDPKASILSEQSKKNKIKYNFQTK